MTCYIVRYDALTWSGARQECQQSGGDLAVINNKNTLDAVAGNGILRYVAHAIE